MKVTQEMEAVISFYQPNESKCKNCCHGIYFYGDESWNCGCGCLNDEDCIKKFERVDEYIPQNVVHKNYEKRFVEDAE